MIWRWLLLKKGVQREDESVFKLLVEDWVTLASSPTPTCSRTAGKYSSALCLSLLPTEQKFLTTHIAVQIISSEIAKCSRAVELRAWEVPRSWWEPEALWACINWNDDDDGNAHFNTKTSHGLFQHQPLSPHPVLHPFHDSQSFSKDDWSVLSLLLSLPVLSSSSLGLCCPTFWLRSLLDYPQPLAHPTITSHHFCLQLADSVSPFTLSAISLSQVPLLTVKWMQISPVPHHKTQKLFPFLTCPNTQDLTC